MFLYNRNEIKAFIPHRGSFLFLQEAKIIDEKSGSGIALWPEAHSVFEGHFPEIKLVPGVLLIEAAAQLSGVIIGSSTLRSGQDIGDSIGVLAGVKNFTVSSPVFPDDKLTINVKMSRTFPKMGIAYVQGKIDEQHVFDAQLILGVASKTDFENLVEARKK